MPQIINNQVNQPTMKCSTGIGKWRVMGLEFATTSAVNVQNAVISCNGAQGVIFDRIVLHGGNNIVTPGQSRDTISQGISLDSGTYNAVINSYVYDIHCLTNGCADSYAINAGGCSVSTTGPTKIVNNYLEAAGEGGLFTGGCGSGASVLPSVDIEFRRNHVSKPLFWKTTDPTYFGTNFEVKNNFELKNANRVLVEGDIFDYSWFGQSDQQGQLMDIGSKNQSNPNYGTASSSGNTLTRISGTPFSTSLTSSTCATANQCKVIFNGIGYRAQTVTDGNHLVLMTSPPTTASASYVAFLPGLNPNAVVSNVTIRYSKFSHASRGINMYAVPSDGGDISLGTNSTSIHDITLDDIDGFHWGSGAGGCCFWSLLYSVQNSFPSPNNMHDIWIFNTTGLAFLSGGSVGAGPGFSFGYQNVSGGQVPNLKVFSNIGTAGWASGSNFALASPACTAQPSSTLAKMQCYDSLNGTALNSFCFDGNILATATQGSPSGTGNTPPYPTAGQSPLCPSSNVGNALPANFAAIGFVNLNGAIGGDYTLSGTSPYLTSGNGNTKPGANITLLNQAIQGVQ
jgi:hypothetical protein